MNEGYEVAGSKAFANGSVHALRLEDGFLVEVTDTFLPYYTKEASTSHENALQCDDLGSRAERWMVGVSCMSGCPVGCKFCATGCLARWRSLTTDEMLMQVDHVLRLNDGTDPADSREFKINYTRMGEPFLNVDVIKETIGILGDAFPNAHHYVSTIGIEGSDFSWIKGNVTLQVSLHSLDDARRDLLIPFDGKMSIRELGEIRTQSNLKTTLNLTLVKGEDFDIDRLRKIFDPEHFFIKLSPINENAVSRENDLGKGIIVAENLR